MTDFTYHAALRTERQSPYAPAALAAYALGATLWAPVLMLVAKGFAGVAGALLPQLAVPGGGRLFAAMWLARFALYALGARGRWDYGYGINGVVVSRRLSLDAKMRRIGTDWFGIVLIVIWLCAMPGVLAVALAG
jgi:hypothetical protein